MSVLLRARGGYTGGIEASNDFVVRSEELFFVGIIPLCFSE